MILNNDSDEPIIIVPAFNANHFKPGMAIQVGYFEQKPYNAIIASVQNQVIRVVGVFDNTDDVVKDINIGDVLLSRISIRIVAR